MKNKGFTLIELLAVIVILAIIALIAVPIILNIINDAKEEANKRSVELYGKAVEQAIVQAQFTEGEVPAGDLKNVTLSNNKKILDTVQYSGNKVECTTNTLYEDGKIYLSGCKVGTNTKEYTYGVSQEIEEETPQVSLVCALEDGTSKTVGAKYTCTVMDDVYFYVLENNPSSENISLIMDRNYTDTTVPAKMAWCDPNGDNPEDNACNHDNLDPLVAHIQTQFGSNVTVSLPTKAQIEGAYTGTMPTWLYDYLSSTIHSVSGVYGYWTASPYDGYSDGAWGVYYDGYVYSGSVNYDGSCGVRPVITISKSLLD